MYNKISMVDAAYQVMEKKEGPVNFHQLWQEVCEFEGFSLAQQEDMISLFYTNIILDGRFITTGDNNWDLRIRHKFEDVNIDMNAIYSEEKSDEEETDPEEDDGLIEDTYDE